MPGQLRSCQNSTNGFQERSIERESRSGRGQGRGVYPRKDLGAIPPKEKKRQGSGERCIRSRAELRCGLGRSP